MFVWGVLKCGIGVVLHWRPPAVHSFGTNPSLVVGVRGRCKNVGALAHGNLKWLLDYLISILIKLL